MINFDHFIDRPGSLCFLSAAECRLNVKIQVKTLTNAQRASCCCGFKIHSEQRFCGDGASLR
ncbi:hypothetical protein ERHA54_25420 [Erwinia rhapontici]|uniref:Uncharacterized protein n=1 Tax=Erwinia rhapontici TaxID=55212 RepID=A0ABM7N0S5_ERWRD|nr:hypothetical protein [Erwinia rhapontici]MCS3606172.1 hypothetical protein [Erwinia rhapontici]TDS92944.1 hypothetical protein EDF84_112116 [Erwinia rhapontici]BCQ35038.1 hypothetical protein ERHA53_23810 [Erwinia rhapontici]BCQ39939.1 hypothetical protein ERHA54_25420 [Erwinia rhapontici]